MEKCRKTIAKRYLTGMLLVMLAVWFLRPETVSAAGGIVLSVNAEVTAPLAGKTPQTALPQSGAGYRYTEMKWYVMNGTVPQEFTGTFVAGKRYIVTLTVKPDVGMKLSTGSDLTATINGQKARVSSDFDSSAGGIISYIFPATRSLVAEGDGWYLDDAGCLYLTGTVENPGTSSMRVPWFNYRSQVKSVIALEGASVNNCGFLFSGCDAVTIDISRLDISKSPSMAEMFSYCHRLESIDLTGLCTDNVTTMYQLFYQCKELKTVNIGKLNMAKVDNIYEMFYQCSSLTSLDLSEFIVPRDSVGRDSVLFGQCDALNEICVSPESVKLFRAALEALSFAWNDKETGALYLGKQQLAGITEKGTLVRNRDIVDSGEGWHLDKDGCLYITGAVSASEVQDGRHCPPWGEYRQQIVSVVTEPGAAVDECADLFYDCVKMVTADLRNLDTTGVTDMSGMFWGCGSLSKIYGLESLKTKDVSDIHDMFAFCGNLESVNLTSFHTGKLRDARSLFFDCKNLKEIDLRGFSVPDECSVNGMFIGCQAPVIKINADLLGRVAGQLMDIFGLWKNSSTGVLYGSAQDLKTVTGTVSLEIADDEIVAGGKGWYLDREGCLHIVGTVSNVGQSQPWSEYCRQIVSVVTEPGAMVYDCQKLFYECENLVTVDLRNLDFTVVSNPTNLSYMFCKCSKLTEVYGLENIITKDIRYMYCMFAYCSNLKKMDIPLVDAGNLMDVQNMFLDCEKLTSLDLSSWNVEKNCRVDGMLKGCMALTTVKIDKALLWIVPSQLLAISGQWKNSSTGSIYSSELGMLLPGTGTVTLEKVPTKLETPVITKLENASTGVKAIWDAVEGAEMYRLMYKEPGGSFVTGGYTTGTSYTVKNLTSGVEYFFTVRCMTADKKTNTSDYDRVGTTITYIAAPVLQKVENAANGVKVTWELSAGAELYKVMYKEPGGSYKTAGYTTENNYTVTGLTAGVEYTFTVRCMTADKKTYTSSYNSKGLTIVYQPAAAKLATPVITKLENAATGVKATWDAVEGAEMYRLMYKEPGGSFVTGGYTTGTSYTVKNLTSGVEYFFTVRCMTADKKTNTSDYDRVGTPITYIAAPALQKVENASNGVKLTWDLSAGAELYKVMYKEPGGSYKTAGYTAENNYIVTGLTAGVEYTFTARCIMADKKTYTSSYDSKGLTLVYQPAAVKLATPVIAKLENTNSGVKVTWGAVDGAEMYRLMYKEPDGSFKTGGYTTGTSYTVKDVTGGVTYAFTVRCMTADKKTNTSDYDRVGTGITYIAPPVLTKVYNTASGVKVTWQASAGAELYKVMYMGPDGTWKTGGYTTSTGYTVKNLTEGTAYAFTVRCMTADKSAYTSGYDKVGLSITRSIP